MTASKKAAATTKPAAKTAAKPAVKRAAAKPAAAASRAAAPKAAAKPVAATKAAAKPTAAKPAAAKPVAKTAAKPAVKRAAAAKPAKVEKAAKPHKEKLVRDSFTMPESEYAVLGQVKKACLKNGIEVKKSELLRIGVALISRLDMATLKQVLASLPQLKTGRPKKA